MSEELMGTSESTDTSVDTSADTGVESSDYSQDSSEDSSQESGGRKGQTPSFKDILKSEQEKYIAKQEGRPYTEGQKGQPVKDEYTGKEFFFADSELDVLRSLPPQYRQVVSGVIDRMMDVTQEHAQQLQAYEEYAPTLNYMSQYEESIKEMGYQGLHDYLEHVTTFEKELARDPYDALALLVFDIAGGTQESLSYFCQNFEQRIYDYRDRFQLSRTDGGYRAAVQQAKQARELSQWSAQTHEQEYQQRYAEVEQMYSDAFELFAMEQDQQGRIKHPYLREVAPKMGELSNIMQTDDLEELYQTACASMPEIRNRILQPLQNPQANMSLTNSPSGTSRPKGGLPSFKECFEMAKAEKQARIAYGQY